MNIQYLVVIALFIGALAYLGTLLTKQFKKEGKGGCGGTCKCDNK